MVSQCKISKKHAFWSMGYRERAPEFQIEIR